MKKYTKKICLIGPEGVGKTSLIRRYVDNKFDDKYISTIGVSLSNKLIKVPDSYDIELILWDLEGFTSKGLHFPTTYLSGASGFVFTCDINNEDSFRSTQKICSELYTKFEDKACFSVALNKTDLLQEEESHQLKKAREIFKDTPPIDFIPTSAKQDNKVGELFSHLSKYLVDYDIPNFRF